MCCENIQQATVEVNKGERFDKQLIERWCVAFIANKFNVLFVRGKMCFFFFLNLHSHFQYKYLVIKHAKEKPLPHVEYFEEIALRVAVNC